VTASRNKFQNLLGYRHAVEYVTGIQHCCSFDLGFIRAMCCSRPFVVLLHLAQPPPLQHILPPCPALLLLLLLGRKLIVQPRDVIRHLSSGSTPRF
jgi:hypothetical protein